MRRRGRSALLALVLLGLAGPVALEAQDRVVGSEPELTVAAREFARHWAAGQAEGLTPLFASSGIRLHLEGPARAAIPPRQATAAVRDFLRGFEEGSAEVTRAAVAGGTEDQGFVELLWSARVAGTSQTVQQTLFLSMARAGDRWRVEELRLLR